jgi:hypothetical protein
MRQQHREAAYKRLKPPPGYDTWLDYAIDNIPTRNLIIDHEMNGTKYWGRSVKRDDIVNAALNELTALKNEITRVESSLQRARDELDTTDVNNITRKPGPKRKK